METKWMKLNKKGINLKDVNVDEGLGEDNQNADPSNPGAKDKKKSNCC